MQGYDFYELNDKYNVTLQIGGSDQWGNMTAGTELRRKADKTDHVMTVPLIATLGKKFGKSEGNAVWLDMTNISIRNVPILAQRYGRRAVRFLKIFTFLSLTKSLKSKKNLTLLVTTSSTKILARSCYTCSR